MTIILISILVVFSLLIIFGRNLLILLLLVSLLPFALMSRLMLYVVNRILIMIGEPRETWTFNEVLATFINHLYDI